MSSILKVADTTESIYQKTEKTPSHASTAILSEGEDRTTDDVDNTMPEIQVCDGSCKHLVNTDKMVKYKCGHIFCENCCKLEDAVKHVACPSYHEGVISVLSSSPATSNTSVYCLSVTGDVTESSMITAITSPDTQDNRHEFTYGNYGLLMNTSNYTYGEIMMTLMGVFKFSLNDSIHLEWDFDETKTDQEYEISNKDLFSKLGLKPGVTVEVVVDEDEDEEDEFD